jgi:putative Ca2+/H+ antiporter (TMEM165/GDT1 family)
LVAYDAPSAFISTLTLVGLAEIGDKSQLVCMSLAARSRAWPVMLGAATAFLLLNALAVVFGAGIAIWLPERITAAVVAVLFFVFGVHALRCAGIAETENVSTMPGHGVFFSALVLIFVAEFGDKTQVAVSGLAVNLPAMSVWLGASVALITVTALGVWAGRTILLRLPVVWLHWAGGILFLAFSGLAALRALDWI